MAKAVLKYLKLQRGRDGRTTYVYFQRNGRQWRLPGTWPQNPPSVEFIKEYHRLLALTGMQSDTPGIKTRSGSRGTMGKLINDYLATGEFKEKSDRTRASYQRICEMLSAEHGHKLMVDIERRHVRMIRDAKAETPGEANNLLRMLKILLNFAVDDGLLNFSPAAKMRELRVGEWRDWSDAECAKFEEHWAPGTMQRRAYSLALYTGQRLSDLVLMTRAHRQNGLIRVVTQKTREELWIPEHSKLTAELARGVVGIHRLLTTPTQGKAFDPVYFGSWFAEAIEKAKLPEDCVLHGLRKCAARTLADLDCTTEQIKTIIGHRTDRMVGKYTKTADKRKRAKDAMAKWEKG